MPDRSSTPASHVFSRRSVVGAAAWTVPAITIAGAAPAFAASETMSCQAVALTLAPAWTGAVTRNRATGWYVRGTYGPANDGYASQVEANWYTSLNLSDGSFLSFENSSQTNTGSGPSAGTSTTIVLQFHFTVEGKITLDLVGDILFGYGNNAGGTTERQLVDIDVFGLSGGPRHVASIAPRRQNPAGGYFPNAAMLNTANAATQQSNGRLKETDAQLAARGYALATPPANAPQGRFTTPFTQETVIVDDVAGTRTLTVQYTLTMPAKYASAWVNDDVIIYRPTVRVNC